MPDSHPSPWPRFTDGQLELLKWIGVVSMFIDHFGRLLFGWGLETIAFGAGRLAFPLFALVLACNLARPGDQAARTKRIALRLAFACAVATLVSWPLSLSGGSSADAKRLRSLPSCCWRSPTSTQALAGSTG